MENLTKEEYLKAIENMSVMQVIALTKELEMLWGLKALPQVVERTLVQVEQVAVQTEFSVTLVSVPLDKKISVIKVVRDSVGLGLKESKEFVESAPKVLKESVTFAEAEALKMKLTEAGAVVEVK